jgi:RNA polymerase sigma factor (sigma-70 family)
MIRNRYFPKKDQPSPRKVVVVKRARPVVEESPGVSSLQENPGDPSRRPTSGFNGIIENDKPSSEFIKKIQGTYASPEDARIDIDRAVGQLPPDERTVFILHDIEGLSYSEISELLGATDDTSRRNLKKAREHLRKLLE